MQNTFSPAVAEKILFTNLSQRSRPDRLCWSIEKKGFYSVQTTCWLARAGVMGNSLVSTSQGDPFNEL